LTKSSGNFRILMFRAGAQNYNWWQWSCHCWWLV